MHLTTKKTTKACGALWNPHSLKRGTVFWYIWDRGGSFVSKCNTQNPWRNSWVSFRRYAIFGCTQFNLDGWYTILDIAIVSKSQAAIRAFGYYLDVQFKISSERQIFWETFHGNFIYSQSFHQKSAGRKSPKKSYFVLMSGLGHEPWLYV